MHLDNRPAYSWEFIKPHSRPVVTTWLSAPHASAVPTGSAVGHDRNHTDAASMPLRSHETAQPTGTARLTSHCRLKVNRRPGTTAGRAGVVPS
jgi:hypothetical protein